MGWGDRTGADPVVGLSVLFWSGGVLVGLGVRRGWGRQGARVGREVWEGGSQRGDCAGAGGKGAGGEERGRWGGRGDGKLCRCCSCTGLQCSRSKSSGRGGSAIVRIRNPQGRFGGEEGGGDGGQGGADGVGEAGEGNGSKASSREAMAAVVGRLVDVTSPRACASLASRQARGRLAARPDSSSGTAPPCTPWQRMERQCGWGVPIWRRFLG